MLQTNLKTLRKKNRYLNYHPEIRHSLRKRYLRVKGPSTLRRKNLETQLFENALQTEPGI